MHADILNTCPLFSGIDAAQLKALLDCLKATRRVYDRDAFVFMADERAERVGIVLEGGVNVIKEDFWGSRVILAHIEPGGLFGEALACAGVERLPVSVVAAERSQIMLVDYQKIVITCAPTCDYHARLMMNMLRILAQKNVMLTRKMEHLSKRTTREKLLSFLSAQAEHTRSNTVQIPFNRQELAEYLCVDRSALSRELSQMRREGLLDFEKQVFVLKKGGMAGG